MQRDEELLTAWLPELLYADGRFARGLALVVDGAGRIEHIARADQILPARIIRLPGRALLPGLVNAHSHSFQRVIRGRTEHRAAARDSFWTWRAQMYAAAARLTPEDMYDAARMAFLEMALTGITAVGEFHYLHHAPDGTPYADPNLLAHQVVRAAQDVGLRIALLRVAYARSGVGTPPNPQQARFIEAEPEIYLRNTEALIADLTRAEIGGLEHTRRAWVGVAPHSIRAVPVDYLIHASNFAIKHGLPVHMHIAEQPADLTAWLQETGCSPLMWLGSEGMLGPHFTAVHAIHFEPRLKAGDLQYLRKTGASICACPTTERNLGDGIIPADLYFAAGVPIALGTDSHAQIDLLEDARELEYHLRLQKLERAVLDPMRAGADESVETDGAQLAGLAARLFDCATTNGARSIAAPGGTLAVGRTADFFTVDLNDPSIAGAQAQDLLPAVVFALTRAAVSEVVVGGQLIVQSGQHAAQEEIIERFKALQTRLWA
ncbi:MAG: formimidoylglutamate deiminase [Pyrinomonadaceae bacterium]